MTALDDTRIDCALTRIETKLDRCDALADRIEAWAARSLEAAPAVSPATSARLARLLAEGEES
jgi:hypothetical protein